MKVERVRTIGLPLGVRVLQYEDADIKKSLETPANLTIVTDIINKYLRQKDALVEFRDDLLSVLTDVIGFKMLTVTTKVDGKDVITPDEKPGEYLDRLTAALISGEFSHARLPVTGADNKAKETSVYNAFQAIADTLGDVDAKGVAIPVDPATKKRTAAGFAYKLDIARPERVSKPKTPPEYAVTGATSIINNGSEGKWAEKFTKGFKDAQGVTIDPIAFQPFDVKPAKDATPAEVEAVRAANILALAWAITEKEAQVREKTAAKKLAEFA